MYRTSNGAGVGGTARAERVEIGTVEARSLTTFVVFVAFMAFKPQSAFDLGSKWNESMVRQWCAVRTDVNSGTVTARDSSWLLGPPVLQLGHVPSLNA